MLSPVNSHASELLHFPTTYIGGWHDDVVDMTVWMLTRTIVRNSEVFKLNFLWLYTVLISIDRFIRWHHIDPYCLIQIPFHCAMGKLLPMLTTGRNTRENQTLPHVQWPESVMKKDTRESYITQIPPSIVAGAKILHSNIYVYIYIWKKYNYIYIWSDSVASQWEYHVLYCCCFMLMFSYLPKNRTYGYCKSYGHT